MSGLCEKPVRKGGGIENDESSCERNFGLQVTHLLGKPLLRVFPELRGIHQLEPGWGLNIVPPPEPRHPQVRVSSLPRVFLAAALFKKPTVGLSGRTQPSALNPHRTGP